MIVCLDTPAVCVDACAVLSLLAPTACYRTHHRLALERTGKGNCGWLAHAQTYTHVIDSSSPFYDMDESVFSDRGRSCLEAFRFVFLLQLCFCLAFFKSLYYVIK